MYIFSGKSSVHVTAINCYGRFNGNVNLLFFERNGSHMVRFLLDNNNYDEYLIQATENTTIVVGKTMQFKYFTGSSAEIFCGTVKSVHIECTEA